MGRQDKNRDHNNEMNQQPQGFISSLESLGDNLLNYVTEDERNNNQEDQLH